MKKAIWYFDFISPFAYLQNVRLNEFSRDIEIERKPLVFAGLLKHWGNRGPVRSKPNGPLLTVKCNGLRNVKRFRFVFRSDIPLILFHC